MSLKDFTYFNKSQNVYIWLPYYFYQCVRVALWSFISSTQNEKRFYFFAIQGWIKGTQAMTYLLWDLNFFADII